MKIYYRYSNDLFELPNDKMRNGEFIGYNKGQNFCLFLRKIPLHRLRRKKKGEKKLKVKC